ncbi:MAG: hypothetical protein KA432_04510 [Proteocatella sp.]|nr:hypothetical protein [Proteocatella sp.]
MNCVFLSHKAGAELRVFLRELGKTLIEIKETECVYSEIADHPDIYVCLVNDSLITSPEQYEHIASQIANVPDRPRLILGAKPLGMKYPESASYNAVQVGRFLIHNTGFTDDSVLEAAGILGLKLINVAQGYANCSIAVVDERSIITSDLGIASAIRKHHHEIEVLTVSPGHVRLEGFEYGFLGGTSGRIGNYVIFNGNLEEHPDFFRIREFIESRSLKLKYFREYPLTDIGSIIGS